MDNQGGIVIYHHHARKAKAKAMQLLLCDYYTLTFKELLSIVWEVSNYDGNIIHKYGSLLCAFAILRFLFQDFHVLLLCGFSLKNIGFSVIPCFTEPGPRQRGIFIVNSYLPKQIYLRKTSSD